MDKACACEEDLCASCEMPLRQRDAKKCGVCRAVDGHRKAMKRQLEKSPQEIDAPYRKCSEGTSRAVSARTPPRQAQGRTERHGTGFIEARRSRPVPLHSPSDPTGQFDRCER